MNIKKELSKKPLNEIRDQVQKDAWIALKQYFHGSGNGPEAKVACVVISTIAREHQAQNNARQLTLLEQRYLIGVK